jgi:hypothetical protein
MVTLSERTAKVSSMVLQQVSVVIYTNRLGKNFMAPLCSYLRGTVPAIIRVSVRTKNGNKNYAYVVFRFRDQIAYTYYIL